MVERITDFKGEKYNGFEVLEKLCESKSLNIDDCEDILVVNENFIAVIDGATSKSHVQYKGKTGGRITAELISHIL